MKENIYNRHYEKSVLVSAGAEEIFNYADDHSNFSSHMEKSSWMMAGGKMKAVVDGGKGRKLGSHIRIGGKILGINLSLDEVITVYRPPEMKVWATVGEPKLIVIGSYELGFEISPEDGSSKLKVFINYDLPQSPNTRWLGYLLGGTYAKWCVSQMTAGVSNYFARKT